MDGASAVDLLVPGDPDSLTGGYVYDRRILKGLESLGWQTRAHALDASFPEPTEPALADARAIMRSLPDGRAVVIDGLALAGLGEALSEARDRLGLVALIHHPLAAETGLDAATAERLRSAERAALRLVRRVVVTSGWTAAALRDYAVSRDRIDVVEPGTDPAPLAPRRRTDELKLLSVATVTPRKGHAVLIDALAPLADRRWTLRCAGSLERDPETVRDLESRIARHGLGSRVELLGELEPEAVASEYARADLFVLPSYLEGYGMAFAEALARGLPIVATTAGAIPWTVPEAAGVLVPPGDAAALEHALGTLMDDRAALDSLALGAERARACLPTWLDASRRFEAVLETLG